MKGLLIQEFKTLFKSPAALSILIIPVVLMIGLGYLLPSGWIVPSAITIGIVGSVLLYFGGSLEEIKRTSFMKSISLTKLNKFTFLSTKVLFSIFVSLFSVLWVLFFAWMFTEVVPFLAINFSHILPPSSSKVVDIPSAIAGLFDENTEVGTLLDVVAFIPFTIQWDKINWLLMLYAGAVTIMVSIAIAFLFVTFSKSSLSFYLMSFGYLLAMILFGGVVMPSFLVANDWFEYLYYIVPNFYTNNVMAGAFGSGLGETITGATDKISMLVGNEAIINASPEIIKEVAEWIPTWDGSSEMAQSAFDNIILTVTNENDIIYLEWVNSVLTSDLDNLVKAIVIELSVPIGNGVENFFNLTAEGSWNFLHNLGLGELTLGDLGSFDFNKTWEELKPFQTTAWTIAWGSIGLLVEPSAVGDFVEEFINSNSSEIAAIIVPILKTKILPITLTNVDLNIQVNQFISTLNGMFNTAGPVDYIVPWIETIVFLGIATKYFRWS